MPCGSRAAGSALTPSHLLEVGLSYLGEYAAARALLCCDVRNYNIVITPVANT